MSFDSHLVKPQARSASPTARESFLARVWGQLPVVVRAVVTGLLVLYVGGMPLGALLYANLKFRHDIPWSVPVWGAYMWFYWHYLQGRWWPRSTAEARRQGLRARPLSPRVWKWSLLAGWLTQASLFGLTWVLGRLVPLGYGFPEVLRPFPSLTLFSLVLMLSAHSGIVEEAAFRGFMQGPIERRHGPVIAILVVSSVFGLGHLTDWQPQMTVARMFLIVAVSVQYGILVYLTGSILPGLVIHAAGDAIGIGLLWWLSVHAGSGPLQRAAPAWSNPLFWVNCLETIVLGVAAVWAFRRLTLAVRSERVAMFPEPLVAS